MLQSIPVKLACCIVAAGRGTRLGDEWTDTPKALVPILGRPMLYYSLHVLDTSRKIEKIVVAASPEAIGDFREQDRIWGFSTPVSFVKGGETRAESAFNALKGLADDAPEMVMIHDCARVCLSEDMLELLLEASKYGDAASLAHRSTDTLRLIEDNIVAGEFDRDKISCLETPQVFPFSHLLELHEQASGNLELPDDTTLFTRAGESVKVVIHDGCNLKITYPEDIGATEGILFNRGWQDASEGEE